MPVLVLDAQGRITLPPEVLDHTGAGPGTAFSLEVSHGVLLLRALPQDPAPPAHGQPRDAEEVVALRVRLGLTRSELARRLGVPVEQVRAWEEGATLPDDAAQRRLALLTGEAP